MILVDVDNEWQQVMRAGGEFGQGERVSSCVKLWDGGGKCAARCIAKSSPPLASPRSPSCAPRVAAPSTVGGSSAIGLRFKSTGTRQLARGGVLRAPGEQSAGASIGEEEAPPVIEAAEVGG